MSLSGSSRLSSRNLATVALKAFGNPAEVLSIGKGVAVAEPSSGYIKVSIKASSVTPEDVLSVKGLSLSNKLSGIAGTVAAGVVASTSAGVTGFSSNDSVLVVSEGVWTDEVVVPATAVAKFPNLAAEQVAALPSILSAWAILNNYASGLKSGDLVVQTNGSGAVGAAISEVGKVMGLNVVNLSEADLQDAKLTDKLKSKGAVKLAVTGQSGGHVVSMVRALAPSGCLISYNGVVQSLASTTPVQVPISGMIFNNVSMHGFDLSAWVKSDPQGFQAAVSAVQGLLGDKKLAVKAVKAVPQSDFLKTLEAVGSTGSNAVLKH